MLSPYSPARFLSTPSARRATYLILVLCVALKISIHALREEGDRGVHQAARPSAISIHALREEGDAISMLIVATSTQFLSTPSARRATYVQMLH